MNPPSTCHAPRPYLNLDTWQVQLANLDKETAGYRNLLADLQSLLFSSFDEGAYIDDLLKDHSRAIDALLSHSWGVYGLGEHDAALLAVGGYGRQELHPASDIDILILINNEDDILRDKLSAYITFLWDIGLDIGQSVRTIDECIDEGLNDVTIATNLFESRPIAGSTSLAQRLQEKINDEHFWPSRDFFVAKQAELKNRHQRFGDHAYRLEPNLKESPGGLRDLHTLAWTSKRQFSVDALRDLIGDHISQDEYDALCSSRDFLWRVRFGLHRLSKRKDDRVLLELQRPLAKLLGYEADNEIHAVESMMRDYYLAVTTILRTSEILLQHFGETILMAGEPVSITRLNDRFQLRNGYLEVTREDVFERQPSALLELFLHLQQNREAKGIRAATIRLISHSLKLIDTRFRDDPECHKLFLDLLKRPRGIYHDFRRMNAYGILAAYIPAFADIVGRMQFDMFHIYTVDEHTLQVVRFVRRLSTADHADEVPEATRLFATLAKPKLLYLAALFHDIGKGRGGDHSVLGAVDAEAFCRQHGLDEQDTELVSWLVRNHLRMSMVAQRRDISDLEVIEAFAQDVETVERLTYLYLLTISDIRGTNTELWNSWRANLLSTLYNRTRNWLETNTGSAPEDSQVTLSLDSRRLAASLLQKDGWSLPDIEAVWENFHNEYFLRYQLDTVRWQTALLLQHPDLKTIVDTRAETDHGTTDITIYTQAEPILFSLVTSVLDQLGLDIVTAHIYTTRDDMALDTFSVLDEKGEPCIDPYRLEQVRKRLLSALENTDRDFTPAAIKMTRRQKPFDVPLEICFESPSHQRYTILEISALNQQGLLANIAAAFHNTGTRTMLAKISTIGERAEDTFYIRNHAGEALEPAHQARLETELRRLLEDGDKSG